MSKTIPIVLMPMSPQQKFIVEVITVYLTGRVDDPEQAALEIWRITRTKRRPVVPPDR